jgi:serine protease Do
VGDIVVRFGNEVPSDERDLLRKIAASMPGTEVTLGVLRDGVAMDMPVKLGEWPRMAWESRDAPTTVMAPHWNVPTDLGVQVTAMTDALAAENGIPKGAIGLETQARSAIKAALVTGVGADTDAARHGISVGDTILQVNHVPVGSEDEWMQALAKAREDGRKLAMVLVLPKEPGEGDMKFRAPKWIAVRIAPD